MPKNNLFAILGKYNLKPNKLMGQNFLIDQNVLKKIIIAADLSKNDVVLEVGPGLGILTQALAKVAGRVVAIEKDKKMAAILQNILSDRNIRNVEIVEGDILKIPNTKYKIQNYKVVANIPYYLTARLIRKFLESANPPIEMILMIQKEVAQRICARPPEMSILAVSVQFYAEPKIISVVSKNSFWPAPKVDSAILKISPANTSGPQISRITAEQFFKVVRAGFSHPRKQIIGNLAQGLKIDREKITEALKKFGLAPEQRAESFSVESWIKLTEILKPIN